MAAATTIGLLVIAVAVQAWAFVSIGRATGWQPYMDEIFHIPQAQRYCAGDFASPYDPKLTTPPGLYAVSVLLSRVGWSCDVAGLRALNLAAGLVLLPAAASFAAPLGKRIDLTACMHVASMPVFAFFSLMYYTDVLSVVLVLATWGLAQRNRSIAAALVATFSLLFRQTNIVWLALAVVGDVLKHSARRRKARASSVEVVARSQSIGAHVEILYTDVLHLLSDPAPSILHALPYTVPLGVGAAFLCINGSIVLGDRSMHEAGVYPQQIGYMACFCLAMSAPTVMWKLWTARRNLRTSFVATSLSLSLLFYFTLQHTDKQHPFILADNRHYAFYLDRWVMQKLPRPALAAVYGVAVTIFMLLLLSEASLFGFLAVLAGSILTLVPTSLLEFRYYLVPFVLWRLSIRRVPRAVLQLELAAWIAIHVVAVYIFAYRPLYWQVDGVSVRQHFMW